MAMIKICGVSTPAIAAAAIAARADYIGLVFFPPSPRNISLAEARLLAQRSDGQIRRVGLFVNAGDTVIAEAVEAGQLDVLQLHGDEPPRRAFELRQRFGLPVWKAIPVTTADDVARAAAYRDCADLVLFDARTPADAAMPGGMGLRFDWTLLHGWCGRPGWGLAGGLAPGNVAEAIAQTGAPLVDTSSGVETSPGVKDEALVQAFCRAARDA